jgi:hypothetical protein
MRRMRIEPRKVMVLLVALLMLGLLDIPAVGTTPGGDDGGSRQPGPLDDDPTWTDPLNDASHVYVNATMPVGVEVSGGDAHLKAGETEGWLASEVITCTPGYRYDLVLLEVETPGLSHVNISVLDASVAPTSGDYANWTIPGFDMVPATDISLNAISPVTYPKVRIQVNLFANGTDLPRLLSWTVLFVDVGEWREEFLGTGKMTHRRNLNMTGEDLTINLDPFRLYGQGWDYEPFPTLTWTSIHTGVYMAYPLENRTGYQEVDQMDFDQTYTSAFGDFDRDGYMDLVIGGYVDTKSRIVWGDDSGTYGLTPATILDVDWVEHVVPGDYNGDGWTDLLMVTYEVGAGATQIFLNDGNGSFNSTNDILFRDQYGVFGYACNLNGDQYDDFVVCSGGGAWGYHGGPNGPDTQYEFFIVKDQGKEATAADLNLDGYADIVIYGVTGPPTRVYMGGPFGVDDDPDYVITEPAGATFTYNGHCGDLNGDGYMEIVIPYDLPGNSILTIYNGSAAGWSSSVSYSLPMGRWSRPTCFDLDKDGYDDLIVLHPDGSNNYFDIFMGGEERLDKPDHRQEGPYGAHPPIAAAIPRASDTPIRFSASFTTENIRLPPGMRWDILDLVSTIPYNTSISFMILNETGVPLTDLMNQTNVDLSSIIPLTERTVSFTIKMTTKDINVTPTIDRMLVNWIDELAWREEFYGGAKVERLFDGSVLDGALLGDISTGTGPQLLFASLRDDLTYNSMSYAFRDGGWWDYNKLPPMGFQTTGAMAASVADVNGDGHLDVAFANYAISDYNFESESQVFLGTPVGWRDLPTWTFNTTGARDVLLEDLNDDGHMDIVFAQEQDGLTYAVDSLLFYGSADGWGDRPDVRFKTKGASGVVAGDLDSDGLTDLAFACYSDASTSTDSMVFFQDENGYCGTVPDHWLPTHGARAVATGDLNGDGRLDLVFANSRSGDSWETDSFAYFAKPQGDFDYSPIALPTKGAHDVKVADVNGDGHLDIAFANLVDDRGRYWTPSSVYLNDGSGGFPLHLRHLLSTRGAMAVEVVDLDGKDWKDLVFAHHTNGTSYQMVSYGFFGDTEGWHGSPFIYMDTMGASDVVAARLFDKGDCGYMSQAITPIDPDSIGGFHTLRYTATLEGSASGTVHVYDAVTWEALASTPLVPGTNEWDLRSQVYFKDHPSIRIVVEVEGVASSVDFTLDDLWVNWTGRVRAPPSVVDVGLSRTVALRMSPVTMTVNVTDEYDPPADMFLTIEHRLEDDINWHRDAVGDMECRDGVWYVTLDLVPSVPVGTYHFQVTVMDQDGMETVYIAPATLVVLNNLPTAPEISLGPEAPLTGDTLTVTITRSARDKEGSGMSYRFYWWRR